MEPSDELIEYLVGLGATPEDLEEWRDELPALASVLALRSGKERLTNAQVAERAGITPERLSRLVRAAGFTEAAPDEAISSEADVEIFAMTSAASELFGEQAILQLTRVIGSSMARIADAAVSAFLVNVELPLHDDDADIGLAVAKANAQAGVFVEPLARSMDVLLRRHILAARRSSLGMRATGGYETQLLAVGFVDLVGSSALGVLELGAALTEFETRAFDAVVGQGGRLVKQIGDEIMFAATDPSLACSIATELVKAVGDSVVPPARAGLAFGDVLTASGDCFGPVVNLAARAVREAGPNGVVVDGGLRAALGAAWKPRSIGRRDLSGFPEPVELWEVEPAS